MPAIDFQTIVIRLLLATLLGGIIGAEREYRNKSAGFRTMIMIALGSCLFTIFSVAIGWPGNADRIASNIVTGIGFLGAGIIYKSDEGIKGLTTAAAVWFTAALGMGIGSGHYVISFAGCAVGIVILALFTLLERRIDKLHEIRTYVIVCDFDFGQVARFESIIRQHRLQFSISKKERKGNDFTITWQVKGRADDHHKLAEDIMRDARVKDFEFIGR